MEGTRRGAAATRRWSARDQGLSPSRARQVVRRGARAASLQRQLVPVAAVCHAMQFDSRDPAATQSTLPSTMKLAHEDALKQLGSQGKSG